MDPAVWFQEDMIMDCKLRAKNCGGCPMLATEYAAQLKNCLLYTSDAADE